MYNKMEIKVNESYVEIIKAIENYRQEKYIELIPLNKIETIRYSELINSEKIFWNYLTFYFINNSSTIRIKCKKDDYDLFDIYKKVKIFLYDIIQKEISK